MRPQIYIYTTTEGITEWWQTRGDEADLDIVYLNWESLHDDYADLDPEDIAEFRKQLKRIADPKVRQAETATFNEMLKDQREAEAQRKQWQREANKRRVNEARQILRDAGELR